MKITDNIAYGLGQRAHKAGLSGIPMDDAIFMRYVEEKDPPLVVAVTYYISGHEAAKIKAESVVIDAADRFGA